MIRNILLALLILGAGFAAAKEKKTVWQQFISKEGGFAVELPGIPVSQSESVKTSSGPIDLTIYALERKKEETAFLAMYSELPASILKNTTAEKRLEYARSRVLTSKQGKLLTDKKINSGTLAGREMHFAVVGGGYVRQRIFAGKDKLYQLIVAGPRSHALGKDADRFLGSFKFK